MPIKKSLERPLRNAKKNMLDKDLSPSIFQSGSVRENVAVHCVRGVK